ncbi:MAG TPA: hypothetical protein DEQ47_02080 [Solibacterales bacterium]|nr:hypothetical protein [Bryobacterales bacterium]
MAELQEQLAWLRQKMARIDAKYAGAPALAPPRLPEHREFVEEVLSGAVVVTARGRHFETEKLYARHRRHGSFEISDLLELPEDLLAAISGGAIPTSHPKRWAFLDTETTGLAGGSGTYAFLIGVGSVDEEGFRVRQFFMRDYAEEPSQLLALAEYLERFDVLITYNGKTYDQPLLETRFRMSRMKPPFGRMEHLDLLFGSRRLWKLRLENCRLSYLERQILGVEREGDVPGELIPHYFFEYIRTQRALRLIPIFHHNVMDIVTLACLTAIVPEAFRAPENLTPRHGADLIGIARWLLAEGQHGQALEMLRRAVGTGLPDALLFRTLFEIGMLEKKHGREDAALAAFSELATSPNPYRHRAYEELAKHYEHRERNYAMALEMVRLLEHGPERARREQRLRQRLIKKTGAKACGTLELSQ